jgi:DNA-binding SARP family transcriptional activator
VRIGVLGAIEVHRGDSPVDLGVRKQRALLAALALDPGRTVPASALVDLLWGGAAPPGALSTLHTYVAGLRRALEPGREARATDGLLATAGNGYALRVPSEAVDAVAFERAVAAARTALGTAAHDLLSPVDPPDLDRARRELATARALWRDVPFPELGDAPAAVAERARLTDLRLVAEELAGVVRLRDGDHAVLAADLERLTAEHPLRERFWALRALALARAGRQADALAALRSVREVLADELGVDPGPELRQVEEAVLRQQTGWTPAPAPPDVPPSRSAPWPLVGRAAELARLTGMLDSPTPAFAALVGEPGIGKSRLAAELAAVAARRGVLVLPGRCSQDEGAPPLWPWTTVLGALGGPAPAVDDEDADPQAGRFRTWDAIAARVLAAAAERPVLLVLDDLHWADASSLRVLRHLVATAETGRLAVVATWRRHPEPTGPLAEVAEALARRHAVRIDLAGLAADDAAELVAAVAGDAVPAADRALLASRTDGNPFFLVEYARLVHDTGGSVPTDLPAAVSDVLSRRLAGLPGESLGVLRAAAVLGRAVRLPLLAAVLDRDEEAVLDDLEPALAAGLVVEEGADSFRFAHALVRDAAYGTLLMARRARLHARAATAWEASARDPQAAGEIARHWLAAGPSSASRAWPAAVVAAERAMEVHAHEEARDLLRAALDAQRDDPAAGWEQRYDVLMRLAEACRLAADWFALQAASEEAVAAAEAAGDVERAARAAVGPTTGALWQPRDYGVVHEPAVAALRRALAALPPGDGELRCRVMLGLAGELYYAPAPAERAALTEEALAMARRLGDPKLLRDALAAAFVVSWRPGNAETRLAMAVELGERAAAAGDLPARATAATLQTVALYELGRMAERDAVAREARALAEQLRMAYLLLVLDTAEAPWLAMQDRTAEAEEVLDRALDRFTFVTLPQSGDGTAGAVLTVRFFQGRLAETLPLMRELVATTGLPVTPVVVALLLRLGLREQAEQSLAELPPIDLSADDWFSLMNWCTAGEVALGFGDAELGAAAYARAAPYAGRLCGGGSGAPLGPVDAFLALAAAAAGETATAARHADRALEICAEWSIPPVAQWLRDQRDRYGF